MPAAEEIVDRLGLRIVAERGEGRRTLVVGPAAVTTADRGDMTFVAPASAESAPIRLTASLVIVDETVIGVVQERNWDVAVLAVSPRARHDFVRAATEFFVTDPPSPGVHPSASVDGRADVHETASIGSLCSIGPDVVIGERSSLAAGVHVYGRARIGADVRIDAGTVIGADGFGFERTDDGSLMRFPHLGAVLIGDRVQIGANTCIDRGALGDTVIGSGACIDNLVHIAHGVQIGDHAMVIAHAMVGGSTRIGARAWIAPSAALRDGIAIGADATVGLGAVVTRSVSAGETVAGSPARPIDELRARSLARDERGRGGPDEQGSSGS